MLLRAVLALGTMAALMLLVWLQIPAANADRYLTVEQLVARGIRALSFDRHYAMPIDFAIFPGLVALIIFLCAGQWTWVSSSIVAGISFVIIVLCVFGLWIGGNEAHVHDHMPTVAGYLHAVYAMVVVWAILMLLINTQNPQPVLLLIICIAVPAFFFVGTHKFLGMINYAGAASSFPDNPLKDIAGWAVIVVTSGLVWWRTYMLIPYSFWESVR